MSCIFNTRLQTVSPQTVWIFSPSLHLHYRSFITTMASADFSWFVVTASGTLMRPHGISCTSFLSSFTQNMRTLKDLSENRNFGEESWDIGGIIFFHTDLNPNSITLVIYAYRLGLPFWTLRPPYRYICLDVEPRFRYPFLWRSSFPTSDLKRLSPDHFNPLSHDSQAWESNCVLLSAGAHGGLTPQMYNMPVVQIITTRQTGGLHRGYKPTSPASA